MIHRPCQKAQNSVKDRVKGRVGIRPGLGWGVKGGGRIYETCWAPQRELSTRNKWVRRKPAMHENGIMQLHPDEPGGVEMQKRGLVCVYTWLPFTGKANKKKGN